MAWSYLCYTHVAHLVFSSTAEAFLTNVSEKRKSALPSAIQVKNLYWKEIKRDNAMWKGEQIVDICCNVTLAHGIVHKIRDNSDRIKERAQSGTKVFV
jgi:hypothetical protein